MAQNYKKILIYAKKTHKNLHMSKKSSTFAVPFEKKGVIVIEKASTEMSEEDLMMLAIEAGADDFETDEEYYEITTAPENFSSVREELEKISSTSNDIV